MNWCRWYRPSSWLLGKRPERPGKQGNMDTNDQAESELFLFSDEGTAAEVDGEHQVTVQRTWRVMIIDDDADVHRATQFALEGVVLFHRPVELIHAHSAAQARDLLMTQDALALVLLDVVMETHDAGLQLVDFIRNVAGHRATRIVLRTGQPGYAPELDTLLQYDINDYKTKSELTHHKLMTTVAAALRSYDPVSYTHLDVYKRQALHRARRAYRRSCRSHSRR